jgi:glycosyltransferase A (GT-A) superfamily protein (DUF2064 family)
MTTLLVVAKQPVPGRVKSRLVPPFTHEQAALLARAALRDTLAAVLAAPVKRRVLVLDGEPDGSLPRGLEVVPQAEGALDVRLAAAIGMVSGPVLVIGMDTPQLRPDLLDVSWEGADAWFGPAWDGGFWALGLREPDPAHVRGVTMSTPRTGAEQRARLRAAGLRVADLPILRDVDTVADALAVAAGAPDTRFAATLRTKGGWLPLRRRGTSGRGRS